MPDSKTTFPPQQQQYPGRTADMQPTPRDEMADYEGRGLLDGRAALVTGADSGIGRAVAVAFAKEGADVAIAYLDEHDDARHTAELVEQAGRRAVLIPGDLSQEENCAAAVQRAVEKLERLDILVNNVAYQEPKASLEEITTEQWDRTFRVNIYSYFWTTREALRHMHDGASVINTSSINGLRGNKQLIDYAATKGAINAFTYSMAQALVDRRIRVNAVAPGPVWTPLIPSTMGEEKVEKFGKQVPMQEPAHPDDVAPSYVFFASERLSGYYTGEVLAPIGGETLPG
ncbi:MAG TPA: SDR family oxidoreductase [Candidatus Dormibacteraeota bacterium]|nr:SDR family oxidoreductase [Candidatus Dormibacteraeota bacterium]